MNPIDYLLDGLEQTLELERELGVRVVECDRSLLQDTAVAATTAASAPEPRKPQASTPPTPRPAVPTTVPPRRPAADRGPRYDFVYLLDRPLNAAGNEMMAKITAALGKTAETAPLVADGDLPSAKVYIALGNDALRKWMPGARCLFNRWIVHEGKQVLLTQSPYEIVRYAVVTPELKKIKYEMWTALKRVPERIANAG